MVSNNEIRRKLAEKREAPSRKSLTEDRTIPSDELKKKFRERNHKSENLGYLVCDKCGGYYELQHGESPDDFADECECGGKLEHAKTINDSGK